MTQFIRMKAVFVGSAVTSTKEPALRFSVSHHRGFQFPITAVHRAGRHGGRPTHADDLAGSEGGWGVPVQHIRQAGELDGGESSNRAEGWKSTKHGLAAAAA